MDRSIKFLRDIKATVVAGDMLEGSLKGIVVHIYCIWKGGRMLRP